MKSREQTEKEALAKEMKEDYKRFLGVYGSLSKELETIKSFLSSLKDINIKHEHEYRLTDEVALKELKTALESVDIPKEILLKKKIHHTTEKISHRFLWWYFAVSIAIIGGCLYYSINSYQKMQKFKKKERRYEILNKYYQFMSKEAPNTSNKFFENLQDDK